MLAGKPPSSSNPTGTAVSENPFVLPPTLSSLADEKDVGSLLRSTAARDPTLPADT
jgi:hypothetical protein